MNIDEKLVKKVGDKEDVPLTEEQQKEWLKCALDKYYFFENYCYIQAPTGKVTFNARDYQRRIIDTATQNALSIFTLGRQSGKTSTFALDVLYDVIFNRDFRVGITSYKNANVLDFMDRIRFTYESLPWWMKPATITYNKFSMNFDNGSSIRSQVTAENTFRGFTLNKIICDELAFVKPAIADEFIASLMPSLSAGGEESQTKLCIISTPKGTEGAFPSIWFGALSGTNGFVPLEVKYEEIPGRTPEFESKMIAQMGREKFMQEFKNAFISSGGELVSSRIMESIKTIDPIDKIDNLELFVPIDSLSGRKLAMACDVAEGVGEDNHCIQVIDIDTFEQVAEFANNIMNQTLYTREILKIMEFFYRQGITDLFYTVEANSIGAGVLRLLENSDNSYLQDATLISDIRHDGSPTGRSGMLTTRSSKLDGCMRLKDMIETYKLKINSGKLLTELKFFVSKGNSFEAEKGMKDDRVMAMVILMNMLKQIANYEDKVYDVINDIENIDDEVWGISF